MYIKKAFNVGDLIILLILILSSFLIINKLKESETEKQISNLHSLEIIKNISE